MVLMFCLVSQEAGRTSTYPRLDPDVVQNSPLEPRDQEMGTLALRLHGVSGRGVHLSFTYGCLHTAEAVEHDGAVATGHIVQTSLNRNGSEAERHCGVCEPASPCACASYVPANLDTKFAAMLMHLDNRLGNCHGDRFLWRNSSHPPLRAKTGQPPHTARPMHVQSPAEPGPTYQVC